VKEFDHALQSQGYGMQTAIFLRASGQGNIECFGSKLGLQFGFVEGIAFIVKGRLKLDFRRPFFKIRLRHFFILV